MDDAFIIGIIMGIAGFIVTGFFGYLFYYLPKRDKNLEAEEAEDKKVKDFDVLANERKWAFFGGITKTVPVKTAEEVHIIVRSTLATKVYYHIGTEGSLPSYKSVKGKQYLRRRDAVIELDPYAVYKLSIKITSRLRLPAKVHYRIVRKQPSTMFIGGFGNVVIN